MPQDPTLHGIVGGMFGGGMPPLQPQELNPNYSLPSLGMSGGPSPEYNIAGSGQGPPNAPKKVPANPLWGGGAFDPLPPGPGGPGSGGQPGYWGPGPGGPSGYPGNHAPGTWGPGPGGPSGYPGGHQPPQNPPPNPPKRMPANPLWGGGAFDPPNPLWGGGAFDPLPPGRPPRRNATPTQTDPRKGVAGQPAPAPDYGPKSPAHVMFRGTTEDPWVNAYQSRFFGPPGAIPVIPGLEPHGPPSTPAPPGEQPPAAPGGGPGFGLPAPNPTHPARPQAPRLPFGPSAGPVGTPIPGGPGIGLSGV